MTLKRVRSEVKTRWLEEADGKAEIKMNAQMRMNGVGVRARYWFGNYYVAQVDWWLISRLFNASACGCCSCRRVDREEQWACTRIWRWQEGIEACRAILPWYLSEKLTRYLKILGNLADIRTYSLPNRSIDSYRLLTYVQFMILLWVNHEYSGEINGSGREHLSYIILTVKLGLR